MDAIAVIALALIGFGLLFMMVFSLLAMRSVSRDMKRSGHPRKGIFNTLPLRDTLAPWKNTRWAKKQDQQWDREHNASRRAHDNDRDHS